MNTLTIKFKWLAGDWYVQCHNGGSNPTAEVISQNDLMEEPMQEAGLGEWLWSSRPITR